MLNRRQFNKGLLSIALSGLALRLNAQNLANLNKMMPLSKGYGALVPDPNAILDLPVGFKYQIISKLKQKMNDGLPVPDNADGMGCFALDKERVALIRNHEIPLLKPKASKIKDNSNVTANTKAFDYTNDGHPLPGGTSNIIYNIKTGKVENEFMSLLGTIRNCSGGATPWGSWLSCEESVERASTLIQKDHGYIFEVPSNAKSLIDAIPLTQMGRFNHEAACVDDKTGIVYLTEDRHDSLFYRFIPKQPGKLHKGGKLQALAISGKAKFDSRNWDTQAMSLNKQLPCAWVDLDNVESPNDDLRKQGYAKGAALFARGEGIHFDNGEMYFCCTNGGAQKLGQIMRYKPLEDGNGVISLFLESANKASFNFGDNITVAPNGHLMVCEDQYSKTVNNKLKGILPNGDIYDFAKVRWQTEPAGVCFSPDGKTMFVNLYSPTATLAITGPWDKFKA